MIDNAADIKEAIAKAEEAGMYEVYAAHLSKIMEVYAADVAGKWYLANVKEERESEPDKNGKTKVKAVTYQMLILAESLADASKRLEAEIKQGYDMASYALRETKIDDVL